MSKSVHSVVIVGGSAAGLRCACRLARLQPGWKITVVEKREIFSVAGCGLPYVLSGEVADAEALRLTADGVRRDAQYFREMKGVEVLAGWLASGVDAQAHKLRIARGGAEKVLDWDDLVLATGARPQRLPGQPDHPRVRSLHSFDDLAPLTAGLRRGEIERVIVVGASFVGCELAEAFAALWGAEVRLFEAGLAPLADNVDLEVGAIAARALEEGGVKVQTGAKVERVRAGADDAAVIVGAETHAAQLVMVAIGMEPVVELALRAGVALGPTRAISVDDRLATSVPHIWAIGDCIQVPQGVSERPVYLPLGSHANRQGRTLANILAGRADRFEPVVGVRALKVFDCHVAAAGVTRRVAADRGLPVRSVWLAARDRADYWPEAKELFLHLLYQPGTRRVVGVQAAGQGDVTKRIDVAAQLLHYGATLEDFARLEHAYAPPFAPALDPLAVAAHIALNQEDGIEALSPAHVTSKLDLLDVRRAAESAERPLGGPKVRQIPLGELPGRTAELSGHEWLVVCERGARSAEAVRRLAAAGIKARYLGGGLHWLRAAGWAERLAE
ncbi:MAG: FAD-dependent oxidoreductase [Deltaproteobacteria bacterium]|nr:FAD-dependent oxidoreductase [Deltaproteobacteria bacterium]